jgi:hypothetical protein
MHSYVMDYVKPLLTKNASYACITINYSARVNA